MENINSLNVIKSALTQEQYKGYLLGNVIQYHCAINSENASDNDKLKAVEKASQYSLWLKDAIMQSGVTIGQKLHNNIIQNVNKIKTNIFTNINLEILKENIQRDDILAWAWHCNIVCSMIYENIDRIAANKAAARIMKVIFDVDITQYKNYKKIMERRCSEVKSTNNSMSFSNALEALKNGKNVARNWWKPGVSLWKSKNTILISVRNDPDVRSWSAGSTDMLAEDWIIVEE